MSVFGTPVFSFHGGASPNSVTINTALGDLIVVGIGTLQTGAVSVADSIPGNVYTVLARSPNSSFGTYTFVAYCLSSTGANASNVVTVTQASGAQCVGVWDIPITGACAFDVNGTGSGGGTTPVTATYSTSGSDDISLAVTASQNAVTQTNGTGYTLDKAQLSQGGAFAAWEHRTFSSPQTNITSAFGTTSSGDFGMSAAAFKALVLFSISGNAGVAGAIVHYVGTSTGTVTADGSGNYTIPNLADTSTEVIWVTLTAGFKSFAPNTSSQTISGGSITGVNFTATASKFGPVATVTGTCTTTTTCTATANTAKGDLITVDITQNTSVSPTSVHDTVGNTYVATNANPLQATSAGVYQQSWYCLTSIGANASNVITVTWAGNTSAAIAVRDVPLTAGFAATFDKTTTGVSAGATNPTTGSFSTANADSLALIHASSTAGSAATAANGYTLDASLIANTVTNGTEHIQYTATQTTITNTINMATGAYAVRSNIFFPTQVAWTISGNAGTCTASVAYSGPSSGTVTANSSGDYSIPLLAAGSYTITPSKGGFTFSPSSQSKTVVSSDITGVNFFIVLDGVTLTPVYVNTLTGANQNPLDPTNLDGSATAPMQILNNVGIGTNVNSFNTAFYIGTPAVGNDQYCTVTIHNWTSGLTNEYFLIVRSNDNSGDDCYGLDIIDNNDGTCDIALEVVTSNIVTKTLYEAPAAALPVACDSFTLAAVGTTIGLWKNSTLLFKGTDTTWATGSPEVSISTNGSPLSDFTITNMIFGNASGLLPPPPPVHTGGQEFGFSDDFMF